MASHGLRLVRRRRFEEDVERGGSWTGIPRDTWRLARSNLGSLKP